MSGFDKDLYDPKLAFEIMIPGFIDLQIYGALNSLLMVESDYLTIKKINTHNTKNGSDWDSVWEQTRSKKVGDIYNKKKLTIFAVSNLLDIPKETVRRKIELLKKKKINYSFV